VAEIILHGKERGTRNVDARISANVKAELPHVRAAVAWSKRV
jgi:hypothetical protein